MDDISEEMLDNLAGAAAELDQFQAKIDEGRLRYKDDPDMLGLIDQNQVWLDRYRRFYAGMKKAIEQDNAE